jgi:hypothetical protein
MAEAGAFSSCCAEQPSCTWRLADRLVLLLQRLEEPSPPFWWLRSWEQQVRIHIVVTSYSAMPGTL